MTPDTRTTEQKIASLRSSRSDLVSMLRRSVHTSRSRGLNKEIDRIDKALRDLEALAKTRK